MPGGEHPWHVHLGRCGVDRGIFGPADAYDPLQVGGKGRAEATTVACGNLAPPSR